MLARLRLKAKLLCGFGLIALIGAVIGVAGIRGIDNLSHRIQDATDYAAFSNAADDALDGILQHRRHEKDVFLNTADPSRQADAYAKFLAVARELRDKLLLLRSLAEKNPLLAREEKDIIVGLPSRHEAYVEGFRGVVAGIRADPGMTPLAADRLMAPFKQQAYELESGIKRIKARGDVLADEMIRDSIREAKHERFALSMAVLLGCLLAVVLGLTVSGRLTRPMAQLTAAADELRQGNCRVEIGHSSNDELGDLADSFRRMLAAQQRKVEMAESIAAGNLDAPLELASDRDTLGKALVAMTAEMKEYIRNLTETTAAKERIQSELRVATDIQASLLPRIFPPFPSRPEFDIFASMDPAKEVGGDFYDFFFIDDTRLCFLIADVADKGVPAALYMMVAKTLLKTEAQRGGAPEDILSRVNTILAADNDRCMFVTVFCAILDTGTGTVRFANAGHNPPLLARSGRGFEYLAVKSGFVLGPMMDARYEGEMIVMQPDDVIFLYTDGVTEAKNPAEELFGEQRLLDALQRDHVSGVTELIHSVRAEVSHYADGAPQSDDVTMLAVRFTGMTCLPGMA